MDKISELPDDLLVKILSYLPTKVAASTMILSKQWQFRWMWLPSLEFGSTFICDPKSDGDSYFKRLQRFLLRNLPLHRAPVIERFVLNLIASDIIIHPEDVQVWVQFSVSRDVRELEISYSSDDGKDILPSSLYTCKFLVTLKLEGDILMEVPRMVVFDDGFVFNKLKYLKLCTCKYYSSNNVLVKLLEVSPNLRVLELFGMEFHLKTYGHYWNQPSSVPECMLTILERFEWSGYQGSKGERELVIYILQNAPRLKTATILLYEYLKETLDIKKQLELSSRASTTCQLLFH